MVFVLCQISIFNFLISFLSSIRNFYFSLRFPLRPLRLKFFYRAARKGHYPKFSGRVRELAKFFITGLATKAARFTRVYIVALQKVCVFSDVEDNVPPGSLSVKIRAIRVFSYFSKVTINFEPEPRALSTAISPPCSITICLTIERPSPVPPAFRERALSVT